VEKIRFNDLIRILTPNSIRDSIRTQTADSQVPRNKWHIKKLSWMGNGH